MMEWLISPLAPNSAVPFVLEVDVVDQCSEVGPVTMASNGLYVLERLSQ